MKSDQPGPTMNDLTSEQRLKIIQSYAIKLIDQMDLKMLEQFAFDVIVETMEPQDLNEILETITFDLGEETLNELVADVLNEE